MEECIKKMWYIYTMEYYLATKSMRFLLLYMATSFWSKKKKSKNIKCYIRFQWCWVGFPGVASGNESSCQCRSDRSCRFNLWVGKIPWRMAWQPTPVFLLGESYRQRSPAGYSPWGHKESDTTKMTSHTHTMLATLKFLKTSTWWTEKCVGTEISGSCFN